MTWESFHFLSELQIYGRLPASVMQTMLTPCKNRLDMVSE